MANRQGPEGVRLAIKATLDTFLAGKLSALNAEYNDGLALIAPKQVYSYEVAIVPELPFVQVFSTGGVVQIDGSTTWNQVGHDVVIQWFVTADQPKPLQQMVDRYALAIQQTLQENKLLDNSVDGGTGLILTKYKIGTMAQDSVGWLMQPGAWYGTFEAVELLR